MKPRDATRRFFSRPLEPRRGVGHARDIPRWFWLAAGIWLAWVLVISEHSFWRISQLKHEIAQAEIDTRKLKDDTARLQAQVSDPEAKRFRAEEIARTQHGWAAPGEIVYKFRGGQNQPDTTR
jgi:cell division protein FtsB